MRWRRIQWRGESLFPALRGKSGLARYLLNRAGPVFPAAVFTVKVMAAPGAIGFFASAFKA
jgi:hypothetical protein